MKRAVRSPGSEAASDPASPNGADLTMRPKACLNRWPTSKWIKKRPLRRSDFQWQAGCGIFSASQLPTQGCARLVSLADLRPGLAQERPFGTGRKKRVDLDAVKTFAATSPCWFQCHQKTTMEQKRQNRNRPVFTYPVLP